MPVDASKSIALNVSRRHFRKISTDEEIELKRARGEISCAECRRLKLKCDKKLPCGSCVRRGCPTICPNGSLSTGQGTRFVLADTEHLHRKIAEMGNRIRSLEDALTIFQAGVSADVHPLLTDELLAIKYGLEATPREPSTDHQAVLIDGLGTLTITEQGDSHYFGRTAASETLLLAGAELSGTDMGPGSTPLDDLSQISHAISDLTSLLPFTIGDVSEVNKQSEVFDALLKFLPEYPRATSLCETYLEHSAFVYHPITREELIDEIFAPVYALAQEGQMNVPEDKREISSHTLALLYLVFAHGALTDLTLPPFNSEAENYFRLGRLALSLQPVYDLPTIQTLHALYLSSLYYANHARYPTLDTAWSISSLANKLAQGMGLHRDPARFNMSPKAVQRRRYLFWELMSCDMYHSLNLGRPPSINLSYVDCEFPDDDTATINDKGEVEIGFFRWKYSFTRDVSIPVLGVILAATPPTYETILELDRKVREKAIPPSLNLYRSGADEYTSPCVYTRSRMVSQFRTCVMIHLHRSFFARAMLDSPSNPLRSPFAPSFLAAYRCASSIIKTTAMNFQKYPDLLARFWVVWNHLLSAAIIVGTVVTRAPSSTMAPAAQLELDLALNLFKSAAVIFPRARSGMVILMNLKAKAQQLQGQMPVNRNSAGPTVLLPETGVDELAVFGGQTQILVSKILSRKGHKSARGASPASTSSASSPSAISEESQTHPDPVPEVHPSLVEYLSMLPPPAIPSPKSNGGSVPTQFPFNQNSTFQLDNFTGVLPSVASGSSPSQQVYTPTSSTTFDGQFLGNLTDVNFFGAPQSTGLAGDGFDNLDLLISGEGGIDERWATLMQDALNPPNS